MVQYFTIFNFQLRLQVVYFLSSMSPSSVPTGMMVGKMFSQSSLSWLRARRSTRLRRLWPSVAVELEDNIEFDGLVMDQSTICGYVKKTSRMLLRFWLSGYQYDVPTLDYQDSLGHAVPTRVGEYISIFVSDITC